jgi:hypothetical protein
LNGTADIRDQEKEADLLWHPAPGTNPPIRATGRVLDPIGEALHRL